MEEKNSEKKERKMRDSGIPWIGEVPEGWGMSPLKYNYNIIAGATPDSTKQNFWDGNIKWITPADYKTKDVYVSFGKRNLTSAGYKACSTHMLPKGSIVISKRAPIGSVAITTSDLCTNQGCLGLVAKNKFVNNKYFYYVLSIYDDVLNLYGSGTTFKEISANVFSNIEFPSPSVTIQNSIADFLDSKCSEIDTLIENLCARVESAKEYKKAVVTEAVTKGLDNDAKMKDSGVECIGEIPEGWSFPKITHILDYTHPYPIGDGDHGSIKATDYTEYGIPFIRVQNLGFATDLCLDNVVYISEAQNRTIQNSTLKPNDILFAKTGATIGKVGIVPESIKKANTTSHVGKITVSESIVPKYIFYVLSSNIGYRQFWDIAAQKSTRPELSIDEIKTIRVLLPKTKEEQQQIADYLDSKCSEIDALLQNYEDQITTLEEYKKSLIYEYVTGKKEVPAA